jgi:hypothetical protein
MMLVIAAVFDAGSLTRTRNPTFIHLMGSDRPESSTTV